MYLELPTTEDKCFLPIQFALAEQRTRTLRCYPSRSARVVVLLQDPGSNQYVRRVYHPAGGTTSFLLAIVESLSFFVARIGYNTATLPFDRRARRLPI